MQRFNTVRATLENHPQGITILQAIENKSVQRTDRKSLVRILVNELVQVHGYYPSTISKVSLAKAIVEEFPLFKDTRGAKGFVCDNLLLLSVLLE